MGSSPDTTTLTRNRPDDTVASGSMSKSVGPEKFVRRSSVPSDANSKATRSSEASRPKAIQSCDAVVPQPNGSDIEKIATSLGIGNMVDPSRTVDVPGKVVDGSCVTSRYCPLIGSNQPLICWEKELWDRTE